MQTRPCLEDAGSTSRLTLVGLLGWMPCGCDLLPLLPGHQLLLDSGGGAVLAQPHLHGLFLREEVLVGLHHLWLGYGDQCGG